MLFFWFAILQPLGPFLSPGSHERVCTHRGLTYTQRRAPPPVLTSGVCPLGLYLEKAFHALRLKENKKRYAFRPASPVQPVGVVAALAGRTGIQVRAVWFSPVFIPTFWFGSFDFASPPYRREGWCVRRFASETGSLPRRFLRFCVCVCACVGVRV